MLLAVDDSCADDTDNDPNGNPTVDDDATIDDVTVIGPCGDVLAVGTQYEGWVPTVPGLYLMLVTVDDDANCPQCTDDPPATYQFTFEVEDGPGCQTCGGGSATAGGVVPATGIARLESVSLRLPLGPATDGEPAGLLRIHEPQPSPDLATPAKLKYKLRRTDVEVIRDPNHPNDTSKPLRQIGSESFQ